MAVLGIHDAHDAGAALVHKGEVIGAINEERFTKLKNDVGFPSNSIEYLSRMAESESINTVAVPWIGGSALFARIFPSLEVKRRKLWRKEVPKPSRFNMKMRNMVFKVVQSQRPQWCWRAAGQGVGSRTLGRKLRALGINGKITFVDHHAAHAASAYYSSGFKEALVITLDGAGDGLSGSVSIGDNGKLTRINEFKAGASLGILYGAATIACDMRYSEDEGKLMSLAAYSFPCEIKELERISRYDPKTRQLVSNSGAKFEFLLAEWMKDNLLWKRSREEFAYAVQKHVQDQVLAIIKQHIKETKIRKVAVAGGLFSNIIINMLIDQLPEVDDFFVFPHVGDGGLAMGAAYLVDFEENGKINNNQIDNLYYGPQYTDDQIEDVLKKYKKSAKIKYEESSDIASRAADEIASGEVMLWFQGRMEYGPRALGNRSVLSLPSSQENRDKINLIIKKRPYYQPFASSILKEDAQKLLEPYKQENKFMTVGYAVKKSHRLDLMAASHIDGTTRPQMLGNENKLYRKLLERIRKKTGYGALLNTSLNKHGRPMVMDPEDAVWTLLNTGASKLAIGSFIVEKNKKS